VLAAMTPTTATVRSLDLGQIQCQGQIPDHTQSHVQLLSQDPVHNQV